MILNPFFCETYLEVLKENVQKLVKQIESWHHWQVMDMPISWNVILSKWFFEDDTEGDCLYSSIQDTTNVLYVLNVTEILVYQIVQF